MRRRVPGGVAACAAAALAGAVVLTGCGASGAPGPTTEAAATSTRTPAATPTGQPLSTPTSRPDSGSASGSQSSSPEPGSQSKERDRTRASTQPDTAPSYPQHVPNTKEADVTSTLASRCVTPGSKQLITVYGPAGYYLSFDVQYSDGKDGKVYGGIDPGHPIPPNGVYQLPWVVSPKAPMGTATGFVAVQGGSPPETAFRQPTFEVAKTCG